MKRALLRQTSAQWWLALVMVLGNACQLVTGVNDLRVEEESEPTTGGSDDTRDAEPTDDEDGSDNTRSDTTKEDASADPSDETSRDTSDETSRDTSDTNDDTSTDTNDDTDDATSTDTNDATSDDQTSRPEGGVTSGTSSGGPDGGESCEIPALLVCAPITNCGCEQGTVCTVTRNEDALTVQCEQPGTAELGAACEPGTCTSGNHCWEGICRQACLRDNDCEEEGASCEPLEVNGDELSKVRYCEAPCNFIAPTEPGVAPHACPEGQSCIRTATSSVCSAVVGLGGQGADCEHDVDCAAGYGCFDQVCKAWCDPEDGECGLWGECQALTDVVGALEPIGACESTCQIPAIPGSTCGVLPNCGCEGGQSCRVFDDGHTECSVIGVVQAQSPCEGHYDCQADHSCVASLCRPHCDPAASDCAQISGCFPIADGIGVCGGSCDAVLQSTESEDFTPCGEGAVCLPGYTNVEVGIPHCAATGGASPLADGSTCDLDTDWCLPGSVCTGICEPLCRGSSDCSFYTVDPQCFVTDFSFLDNDGSEFGVCCLPGPVEDSECSTFGSDCGCPDGEACRLAVDELGNTDITGRTVCSPAGEVTAQSICASDGDCIRGTSCVDGLCRPHCADTCLEGEGTCAQISVSDIDVPYARVCLGLCDPRAPADSNEDWAGCGEGVKCIPGTIGDADYPLSQCTLSLDDRDEGDLCDYHVECRTGLACICTDGECTEATCQTWCVDAEDCDAGETCVTDIGRQIVPGIPIGFCSE